MVMIPETDTASLYLVGDISFIMCGMKGSAYFILLLDMFFFNCLADLGSQLTQCFFCFKVLGAFNLGVEYFTSPFDSNKQIKQEKLKIYINREIREEKHLWDKIHSRDNRIFVVVGWGEANGPLPLILTFKKQSVDYFSEHI